MYFFFVDPTRFMGVPEDTLRILDQHKKTKALPTEMIAARRVDSPIKLATVLLSLAIHQEECGQEARLPKRRTKLTRAFSCRRHGR